MTVPWACCCTSASTSRRTDWAEAVRVNVTTLAHCVAVAVTMDADAAGGCQQQWSGVRGAVSIDEEPGLFGCFSTTELRDAGVPEILLPVVRGVRDDAALDELTPALEADLCERLVALYLGEDGAVCPADEGELASVASAPEPASESEASPEPADGLDHLVREPDLPPGSTQALPLRDIDPDDFQRMLENPTEWWVAFADPVQRKIAEGTFSGAVLVTGGAGTGKTIVAMHRARHLARKGKRVLITSYNVALCEAIRPGHRAALRRGRAGAHHRQEHRRRGAAAVSGRPDGPGHGQERAVRASHQAGDVQFLSKKGNKSPYDAVIVDETQDVDVSRLALIRLLAGKGRDSLTLLGDMNQRIYGEPLDLEDLHISVEGRTFTLAVGIPDDAGDRRVRAADPARGGGRGSPISLRRSRRPHRGCRARGRSWRSSRPRPTRPSLWPWRSSRRSRPGYPRNASPCSGGAGSACVVSSVP